MFSTTDTIVAIATPAGRGGLGVVRVSGPAAHAVALHLLGRRRALEPRHATLGRVTGGSAGRAIDEVVVTWFQAPHSYTREDVIEIAAHGSPVLLRQIVEGALAAGARLAEPGEFTLRAYLNGRLDLIQAEAVGDLVDAVTPVQARAAMDQLDGTLTTAVRAIEASLFDLAARLEASLDFPDEGFHFITRDEARTDLARARSGLERLVRDGPAGRLIREGALVVIGGRPNAGKSTLFNALAGAPRAIVTDVPGTTRDVLSERVDLAGLAVTLVDTAGLRETTERVEAEGVTRAREALTMATLRLWVVDASAPRSVEDDRETSMDRTLIVVNKIDLAGSTWGSLPTAWRDRAVPVSAVTGQGLDRLRDAIAAHLTGRDDWRDAPAMSNVRHLHQVERALEALDRADSALGGGAAEELVLAELGQVRDALEAVTGRRTTDEILRQIFSRFCIGK